jgi:long-chain acyl-CoA synthetase
MSVGRVGQPIGGADIKLVNWEEGNYRVDDKPHPRGEVWIGGDMVGNGYFDLPEATATEFFEEGGKFWFKTGDIALMEPDGVLRIIDRKKDLVKLQFGEYVSLGKVESELKSCPYVDNICIYGDSMKTFCVALVVPVQSKLEQLATSLGVTWQSLEELCKNEKVTQGVMKEIVAHGKKSKLQKFEIPGSLKLCPELWTPESNLVTAAFKLKRKPVQEFYQRDINMLYAAGPMTI